MSERLIAQGSFYRGKGRHRQGHASAGRRVHQLIHSPGSGLRIAAVAAVCGAGVQAAVPLGAYVLSTATVYSTQPSAGQVKGLALRDIRAGGIVGARVLAIARQRRRSDRIGLRSVRLAGRHSGARIIIVAIGIHQLGRRHLSGGGALSGRVDSSQGRGLGRVTYSVE